MPSVRKPKNPYFPGSKIAPKDFEALIRGFLVGARPSTVAVDTGLSPQTVNPVIGLARYELFGSKAFRAMVIGFMEDNLFDPRLRNQNTLILVLDALSGLLDAHPNPRDEYWSVLHHCMFHCPYGSAFLRLADIMGRQFQHGDDVQSEAVRFHLAMATFSRHEEILATGRLQKRAEFCKQCPTVWTSHIAIKIWRGLAIYFRDVKRTNQCDFPYRLFHALYLCSLAFSIDAYRESYEELSPERQSEIRSPIKIWNLIMLNVIDSALAHLVEHPLERRALSVLRQPLSDLPSDLAP